MTTTDSDRGRGELTNVRHLPVKRADDAVEVLEGTVLTAQEYAEIQRAKAAARRSGYRRDVVTVYRAVTHQRTRQHLKYPLKGAAVVYGRWRDAHGAGRYERQMRAAEVAGDEEKLRYWQEADVTEKQRRHQRVMDWVKSPWQLVKAAALGVGIFTGLLLVLGIILAIHSEDAHLILAPSGAVLDAVAFTWWFLTAYGVFLLVTGTIGAVAYLYQQGRKHAEMPQWMGAPERGDGDVMDDLPDEGTIVNAIKNLNIRGFNQALKEGWRVRFEMPPVLDGKGWRAQLALPPACPVEEIVKRKNMLAHNLVRFPIEVWPTEPQPSVLDLWVAKPGALSGPVDPWPLLKDLDNAKTDYFAGVPAGVTIRGDVVRGRLYEANYVMGGVMGSGKSTLAITLVLGAMLDPLVEIDVVVMAENADYEPMRPRLRSLTTGAGEETVSTCMAMLRDLYDETTVRGQALREHDERFVTRELAEKDARLRPRIMVVDECQNLFISEHGESAIKVAAKVMSTARKYGITLMFLTPEPSQDACPRKLISIASNKACFAIGDQIGNDAVLGTGSYKAGISAVGLTPKTDEGPGDIGTCMCRGFMAKPGLLRSFYVPQGDAHLVTRRAMQLLDEAKVSHGPGRVERDVLADVLAVMDGEPGRAGDVVKALAARWPRYQGWKIATLVKALAEFEVRVPSTDRKFPIDPDTVRYAMVRRDAEGAANE